MAQTWGSWTDAFLRLIGAPTTDQNYACIYAIIAHEGTRCAWNPLAITGAGSPCNSAGVGAFASQGEGYAATYNFLSTPGAQDYPGRILAPLRGGNGRQALQGFDATGAWSGDFPGAYSSYTTYLADPKPTGGYGQSPLLADPGHGEGDIGAVVDATPFIPTISDVYSAVTSVKDALKAVGHFLYVLLQRATWVRIGQILGGIIIIGFAISLVNKDIYGKNPVLNAAKTVARVAA